MLKVHVPVLAQTIAHISGVQSQLQMSQEIRALPGQLSPELAENEVRRIGVAIVTLRFWIKHMQLSHVLTAQLDRLEKRLEDQPDYDARELEILLRELQQNFLEELNTSQFLMIPPAKRELYEQEEPAFGEEVNDNFPDAIYDIKAASRCVALDEWTAAVFHLMRVLEHGLRWLANEVGITMAANIEYQQWYSIINEIEAEIRKLDHSLPKDQRTRLSFYSGAAANFRAVKEAWRNHVSHSRSKYDEREATGIWLHVKATMQALARGCDARS